MKKEDFDKIVAFIKTPRGKALLFFGFYFIFFIVIGTSIRNDNTSSVDNKQNNSSFDFSMESITNNNFGFTYEVLIDEQRILYNGIKNDLKEEFNIEEMNYYKESENYFVNTNGVWIKCENPYLYNKFYDTNNILTLLTNASYVSKTEYDSGKKVYIFSIASASINKVFENNDLDIEEVPNEIVVSVDEFNYVTEVKFKLDSYCKAKNICTNRMIIDLNYSDYGSIE